MLGVPFLEGAIWKWFRPHLYDDTCDRLNYFITATTLAFFAIMVSAKQYVGSPIQCWMPMEFKGGWEQYAEDYCFIQNTYFTSFEDDIPSTEEDRQKAEIGYYQWVPIVLALQAIMFYLPNFVWKTLHQQSGVDLSSAIRDARAASSMYGEERKKRVGDIVAYLEECLSMYTRDRSPARILFCRFGKYLGSYVSMLYLFVKALYLINVIAQFYIMNKFLGTDYTFWGWDTFNDLINGREWHESGVFPRVTMCDFKVRRLANIHRYTVQCVIMINMFNEKIYLFLWFWMFFLAVVTVINFFYSLIRLMFPNFRQKSCDTWLAVRGHEHIDHTESMLRKEFVMIRLKADGVLLMRLIEGHAGAIVAKDIVTKLFTNFVDWKHKEGSMKSTPRQIHSDGLHESLYPDPCEKKNLLEVDYAKDPTMA